MMPATMTPAEPPRTRGADDARITSLLTRAAASFRASQPFSGDLSIGIDLGTATCVLVAVDSTGQPVWIDSRSAAAIRDGVVVDFMGARAAVSDLKEAAERELGIELTRAGTAFPPGVPSSDTAACRFVLEGAGFDSVELIDEVSAAHKTLDIADGILVDVGGGSTGVGIFRDGVLVEVDDRPGGGHHLNLILAGALGIDTVEAEALKLADSAAYAGILKPGIQRIASSIAVMSTSAPDLDIFLAGGAVMVYGAPDVISAELGRPVHAYPHSLFITPVGIARSLL